MERDDLLGCGSLARVGSRDKVLGNLLDRRSIKDPTLSGGVKEGGRDNKCCRARRLSTARDGRAAAVGAVHLAGTIAVASPVVGGAIKCPGS